MPELSKNQIKFIKSLHQKKYRQEHQLFLLEGEKLVNEALRDKPNIIQYLVVKNDFQLKLNIPHSIPIYTANDYTLQSISTLTTPPPVLSVCNFIPAINPDISLLKKHFTFYLDNINDPGNLGTIIRICDWFGIPQIFCSKNSVDLYNPKTIQASKGSFLRVNVSYINFDNLNLSSDINIYLADLKGKSIFEIKDKTGIIVLGNESHGISEIIKSMSEKYINIPKHHSSKAESLNVAMSAAMIASEFSKNYL